LDLTGDKLLKALTDERDYLRARVLQLEAKLSEQESQHQAERMAWLDRVIPPRKPQEPRSQNQPTTHYPMEAMTIRPPVNDTYLLETEAAIMKHLSNS
jgi:hypothetical protein